MYFGCRPVARRRSRLCLLMLASVESGTTQILPQRPDRILGRGVRAPVPVRLVAGDAAAEAAPTVPLPADNPDPVTLSCPLGVTPVALGAPPEAPPERLVPHLPGDGPERVPDAPGVGEELLARFGRRRGV